MRTWTQHHNALRTKTQLHVTLRTKTKGGDTVRTRTQCHGTFRTRTRGHGTLRARTQWHKTHWCMIHGHDTLGSGHGAMVLSRQGHAGMSPSCPSPPVGEDIPSIRGTLELPVLPGSPVLKHCGVGPVLGPVTPVGSAAGTWNGWCMCAYVQDRWIQGLHDRMHDMRLHVTGRDRVCDNHSRDSP